MTLQHLAVAFSLSLGFTLSATNTFAQVWQPIPLRTAEVKSVGIGGEGCQWPLSLAADMQTGQTMYMGTDVGGIYRSVDGGKNWAPANIGLKARGACSFAVDPMNADRVLLVACNSLVRPEHGIYLSTDRGQTWKHVKPDNNFGYRDVREQLAFDPASYDSATRKCRVAYWSREITKGKKKDDPEKPGALFKSIDGGETWSEVPDSAAAGDCILKVHPRKGWLYAGGREGLLVSKDEGKTFTTALAEPIQGLDVIATAPDNVYVSTRGQILISTDSGATFTPVPSLPAAAQSKVSGGGFSFLKVSPSDPKRMAVNLDEGPWKIMRYVTTDGGQSWQVGTYDNKLSFIPYNNRKGAFVWDPRDPAVVWSFGGDYLTRSTDAGDTWTWANHGYTGIMTGRSYVFNAANPDLLLFPSQDYDAALTTNGGDTWKRMGFSGQSWGGFIYGAYAATPELAFAGNREGWGGPTELRITRDGGKTYEKTGLKLQGESIGYGDPTDPRVLFFGNLRSDDMGVTWKPMADCKGVFTHVPSKPGTLYGAKDKSVVSSTDKGLTWKVVTTLGKGSVHDIAVDPAQDILYIATQGSLLVYSFKDNTTTDITARLPLDWNNQRAAHSVAVDPVNPRIVYACWPSNTYLGDSSCYRSTDGGATWQTLTRNTRNSAVTSGPDGARESLWVRVHPRTREAWFGTSCFGIWKIAPPK